jgi:hypothetical protein
VLTIGEVEHTRSVSVKATNEGVVRLPWSLAIISIRSSRKIPTQEYVVPRSMPTAGAIVYVICRRCGFYVSVWICAGERENSCVKA